LVRALQPEEGVEVMTERRGRRPHAQLTNGPAKLAQALAIDKSLNGANLCDPNGVIWIENVPDAVPETIVTGPRVGLGKTPEPWLSIPWRYWIQGNSFVSK
ncbi:MAG TPA: DNA-3-methyladenine glycosylase, partial [Anaerolineae bacterium]|nr:DNA-3-methyladenine glycosylase [Anaerolineae bacterium]